MMRGSCLCGSVRYEVDGEFESFYLCHCTRCQKSTGSAHAANLFSTRARLRWVSGEAQVKTFALAETRHARSFCMTCGAALPQMQMEGKLLVVPAGSLDDAPGIRPDAHLFAASRAAWDHDLETVHAFEGLPSAE